MWDEFESIIGFDTKYLTNKYLYLTLNGSMSDGE